ncbi:MAG: transposase [Candidatus Omnitrophota bacterium]
MPRQARLDYPGALHHVIARGIDGIEIFQTEKEKQAFLSRLKKRLSESNLQIYSWCLMDNHCHLLIQTGKTSLSEFMQSVLTGYAVFYNKAHKRKGYVFQNRYKSILCQTDEYLLPLIRYIHLNPVKAKVVTFDNLAQYLWTGHKELIQNSKEGIINSLEVLRFFGTKQNEARKAYLEYLRNGLSSQEDFMGGGLIRSLGGIEAAQRITKEERQNYDERILGEGSFVNEVLSRLEIVTEEKRKIFKDIDELLERLERYYHVKKEDILRGQNKKVREARNVLVYLSNACLGESLTAIGKILKIKQSSASRAKRKGQEVAAQKAILDQLLEDRR